MLQAEFVLHLLPDTTRFPKLGDCKIVLSCDVRCFSTWLQPAMHCYAEAGQPITKFLTRPLAVGTKCFAKTARDLQQCLGTLDQASQKPWTYIQAKVCIVQGETTWYTCCCTGSGKGMKATVTLVRQHCVLKRMSITTLTLIDPLGPRHLQSEK